MNKSKLRQLVKEAIGYSKYAPGGTTKGGTTDDFRNILTAIARGDQEEYEGDPVRGNKILDRANPDNVDRITRGEEPIYEQQLEQVDKQQAISYLKSNDATQYSVDASRGVSQRFSEKQQAIEAIANSPYNTFEIKHQGDRIRVYIPSDAGFEDMVRSMGSLD